jgi:hypothetical protein
MKRAFKYWKYLVPALIVLLLGVVLLYEPGLSKDQKETLKIFDYPSQFTITYIPRGNADKPQLVREETWYYPGSRTKIVFLGGKFAYQEENLQEISADKTPLRPQDFDFFLTYRDLEKIFGAENIIPVNFMPVLYEENETATYVTDLALFIIEDNHLTYFETLSSENKQLLEQSNSMPPAQDVVVQENTDGLKNEWKTHTDSILQMKIKYPQNWYMEDESNVLSTYDTGYLEKGLELPEKILKCDFFDYKNSGIEIEDPIQIINEDVSVYEGKAVETEHNEGPGLGDAHMFLFRKDGEDSIGLLCYFYDESFYTDLLEMLATFEFME